MEHILLAPPRQLLRPVGCSDCTCSLVCWLLDSVTRTNSSCPGPRLPLGCSFQLLANSAGKAATRESRDLELQVLVPPARKLHCAPVWQLRHGLEEGDAHGVGEVEQPTRCETGSSWGLHKPLTPGPSVQCPCPQQGLVTIGALIVGADPSVQHWVGGGAGGKGSWVTNCSGKHLVGADRCPVTGPGAGFRAQDGEMGPWGGRHAQKP